MKANKCRCGAQFLRADVSVLEDDGRRVVLRAGTCRHRCEPPGQQKRRRGVEGGRPSREPALLTSAEVEAAAARAGAPRTIKRWGAAWSPREQRRQAERG